MARIYDTDVKAMEGKDLAYLSSFGEKASMSKAMGNVMSELSSFVDDRAKRQYSSSMEEKLAGATTTQELLNIGFDKSKATPQQAQTYQNMLGTFQAIDADKLKQLQLGAAQREADLLQGKDMLASGVMAFDTDKSGTIDTQEELTAFQASPQYSELSTRFPSLMADQSKTMATDIKAKPLAALQAQADMTTAQGAVDTATFNNAISTIASPYAQDGILDANELLNITNTPDFKKLPETQKNNWIAQQASIIKVREDAGRNALIKLDHDYQTNQQNLSMQLLSASKSGQSTLFNTINAQLNNLKSQHTQMRDAVSKQYGLLRETPAPVQEIQGLATPTEAPIVEPTAPSGAVAPTATKGLGVTEQPQITQTTEQSPEVRVANDIKHVNTLAGNPEDHKHIGPYVKNKMMPIIKQDPIAYLGRYGDTLKTEVVKEIFKDDVVAQTYLDTTSKVIMRSANIQDNESLEKSLTGLKTIYNQLKGGKEANQAYVAKMKDMIDLARGNFNTSNFVKGYENQPADVKDRVSGLGKMFGEMAEDPSLIATQGGETFRSKYLDHTMRAYAQITGEILTPEKFYSFIKHNTAKKTFTDAFSGDLGFVDVPWAADDIRFTGNYKDNSVYLALQLAAKQKYHKDQAKNMGGLDILQGETQGTRLRQHSKEIAERRWENR